jgi:hypothetical protein
VVRRGRGLQPSGNENALRRDLRLAIRNLLGVRERHDAGRVFHGLALVETNGKQASQQPLPGVEEGSGAKTEPQKLEAPPPLFNAPAHHDRLAGELCSGRARTLTDDADGRTPLYRQLSERSENDVASPDSAHSDWAQTRCVEAGGGASSL